MASDDGGIVTIELDVDKLKKAISDYVVEHSGIDRSALLEISDDIERESKACMTSEGTFVKHMNPFETLNFSFRIRKALGVTDEY